jgi:hypothetical protein
VSEPGDKQARPGNRTATVARCCSGTDCHRGGKQQQEDNTADDGDRDGSSLGSLGFDASK